MRSDTVSNLESVKTINLFLARLFLKEVDADLLNQLRSAEMAPILKSVGVDLSVKDTTDEEFLEQLAVEFTALFIAPGSMPPYQSVAEEGRFLADAADKAELFYQKCGYDYRKEYPKLFPDHLGIQLSFMASLIDGEVKAINENNLDTAYEIDSHRMEFFQKHLGKWHSSYFDQLLEGIKHPFYKSVTEFARAFLDEEAENMISLTADNARG